MDINAFGRAVGRLAPAAGLAITMSAIAVPALSAVARADGCTNATLKGEYAFGATAFPGPHVVAGIKVFDGSGNLTQRDYQGNATPAEFAPPGQERGTYAVNPDCTGSMVINLNGLAEEE